MPQTVIDNPIVNSPFAEPARHFRFSDEGITNEIVQGRRTSQYFVPVAQPRKRGKQTRFDTEWTQDRIEENRLVNQVRERVALWRKGGYLHVTPTTRRLLEYWRDPEREHKLFFCQIEALETAVYLTEIAAKTGDNWIQNTLQQAAADANPALYRVAFKMATGSGKTVVMAMLIAWQTLNKLANPRDARFSDTFLIVTPGITIRDRLRVLLPNDPANYYRQHDIVPREQHAELDKAKILITNFHAFLLRERGQASKRTKEILTPDDQPSAFRETPDEMVRRVCRELGTKRSVIVINDEAHHCYRHRVGETQEERLKGDERKEAERREEAARVWISGLEAVQRKIGVKTVYDLSATPFFLRGSGYSEGTLFPWVVSDFSLIDAIEAGIVKVPRVPVADDSMTHELPTYRDIWSLIREHLPKKGRGTEAVEGEPRLPKELQGALHSLYGNYNECFARWQAALGSADDGATPPVFIVVCNNTNVSKLVFDWISGYEKPVTEDQTVLVPGALPLFSNVEDGQWLHRPVALLIDSEQLESGDALSPDFKKLAARQIEEFKAEYRTRFPGRDPDKLSDADILREVMNTIGKPGKLGEQIRCVVSVSMLTEGWDATTVTHILGVRAFGTQLLCEQVVGRGLRRMSFATQTHTVQVDGATVEFESFSPEYAEVYGVPFSFIPCSGSGDPKPGPNPTRVRALPERIACEITFPRVLGYRWDVPPGQLTAKFTDDSCMTLSTAAVPTMTEMRPIYGQGGIHTLADLESRRPQEVAFLLSKLALEKYFRQDPDDQPQRLGDRVFDAQVQAWRFPEVLHIAKQWLGECVVCHDGAFPQLLLLVENAHTAAERIYNAIASAPETRGALKPILAPYDTTGSTRYVDFDTVRDTYRTRENKCHISHVVGDTATWEQKMAQTLESMDEVVCYVKNQGLGFYIPYTLDGREHRYLPDFLVRVSDGQPAPLNLIIEVTGAKDRAKEAKVSTARNLWVPAVNNHGGFGRWAFVEIRDPWNAMDEVQQARGSDPLTRENRRLL